MGVRSRYQHRTFQELGELPKILDDDRFVPKLYRAATIVKEIHELLHMEDKRGKDR